MQADQRGVARCIGVSAVLLAVLLISLTPVIGATAAQSDHPHSGDGIDEGQMNVYLSDYRPGAQEVDIEFNMKGGDAFRDHVHPWGFEYLDSFAWDAPHGPSLAPCTVSDVTAAGIDRDDDNEGTTTDVSILPYLKGAWLRANSFGATMYNGDELSAPSEEYRGGSGSGTGVGRADGDSNLEYYPDDRIYTKLSSCVSNPDEEGWYQWTVKINGTNWDGYEEGAKLTQKTSHQGAFVTVTLNTNWIPICEGCKTRSDAREVLGPPPGEEHSTSTPTSPTPTPDSVATATATATPTPTPTPTPEPDSSSDSSDSTPTPTQTARQATPTSSEKPQQGGNSGGSGGGGGNSGGSSGNDGGGDASQQSQREPRRPATEKSIPLTPTIAEGPGFGAGLALLALVGAALLALHPRRREE